MSLIHFREARTAQAEVGRSRNPPIDRRRFPLEFFLLVVAFSIPFWLVGEASGLELLPGLPASSLMAVCPLIAASTLVYLENQTTGLSDLLKRSFDFKRISAKVWYVPILLLMPGAMFMTYELAPWTGLPFSNAPIPSATVLVLVIAFFIAALCEELGWSGYATDRLQQRSNALQAGMLLGVAWAAWHVVPLVQAHRSPTWIAWWCVYTVATRVLIVWIYNNSGKSVFAAALYHAVGNVCTLLLFPSYYDPRITGLIIAATAAIVVAASGPRMLGRRMPRI